MYAEMEVVAEPIVPTMQGLKAAEEEAEADEEDSGEPFILNVLNED
jgi:hypothetical protein